MIVEHEGDNSTVGRSRNSGLDWIQKQLTFMNKYVREPLPIKYFVQESNLEVLHNVELASEFPELSFSFVIETKFLWPVLPFRQTPQLLYTPHQASGIDFPNEFTVVIALSKYMERITNNRSNQFCNIWIRTLKQLTKVNANLPWWGRRGRVRWRGRSVRWGEWIAGDSRNRFPCKYKNGIQDS